MKPALYVASSQEGIQLANGIQANLDCDAYVTTWEQGFFSPGSITLDALVEKANDFDFGLFVFSPDDQVNMRMSEFAAVRDNVLFERHVRH